MGPPTLRQRIASLEAKISATDPSTLDAGEAFVFNVKHLALDVLRQIDSLRLKKGTPVRHATDEEMRALTRWDWSMPIGWRGTFDQSVQQWRKRNYGKVPEALERYMEVWLEREYRKGRKR